MKLFLSLILLLSSTIPAVAGVYVKRFPTDTPVLVVGATSSTTTSGNCAKFDSNGNVIDAGAPCDYGSVSGLTTNYIPVASGPAALVNSQIFDNGTIVNIGATTTGLGRLTVSGGADEGAYINSVVAANGIDSFNKLALHMDDASLSDSATTPKTTTINGGVTRSAAQSVFGGFSALFDSTTGYLTWADSADFNLSNSDFTFRWRMKVNTLGINQVVLQQDSGSDSDRIQVILLSTNKMRFLAQTGAVNVAFYVTTNAIVADTNWHAYAIERVGSTFRIYIDGVSQALDTTTAIGSGTIQNYTGLLYMGRSSTAAQFYLDAYIDEFMYDNGVARYNGNYTVETAAFSSASGSPWVKFALNGSVLAKVWTDQTASNAFKVDVGGTTLLSMATSAGTTLTGGTGTTSDLNFKTTTGVGAAGADMHFLVGNNGATEAMTILNSGFTGHGTAAPTSLLTLQSTGTGLTTGLRFLRPGVPTEFYEVGHLGGSAVGTMNDPLVFSSGFGTNVIAFDRSGSAYFAGSMGIGTSSPSVPLHVSTGNSRIATDGSAGATPGYEIRTANVITSVIYEPNSSNDLRIYSNGADQMTFTGNKVGIGTTSPTNILSLSNAAAQKFWIESTATDVVGRALTVAAGGTIAGTGTSNVAGGSLTLQAGLGSGSASAASSGIIFQTGIPGASGLTLQTMGTKMTISPTGYIYIGNNTSTSPILFPFSTASTTVDMSGTGLSLFNYNAATINTDAFAFGGSSYTVASGATRNLVTRRTFAPTSGTATYAGLNLIDTINQTGGASGITRSLYVLPTLTAAADYRGVEVDVGASTHYGFYQAGASGKNLFAGSLVAATIATTATSSTLAAAATSIAVTSNVMTITGDAGANTVATITGGLNGQILTLIFADALVTITDDATGTANTVNLSAAFTSTANDVVTVVFNGTSWREVSRSIN